MVALKASSALRWIQARLGYEPGDTPAQLELLNFAGRHMVAAHPWKWLTSVADLGTTASQNTLDLPSDFGSLLYVQYKSELVEQVEVTSIPTLLNYERGPGTFDFYVAIVWATESNIKVPKLRVFPVPTTTDADRMQIYYRADWTEITADSGYITIPEFMHPLFREVVSACALGWNEADDFTERTGAGATAATPYLRTVWAGDIAMSAKAFDGRVQRTSGKLQNGIVPSASGRFQIYSSTQVQDPT